MAIKVSTLQDLPLLGVKRGITASAILSSPGIKTGFTKEVQRK